MPNNISSSSKKGKGEGKVAAARPLAKRSVYSVPLLDWLRPRFFFSALIERCVFEE
jgi:hypothetical protein